MKKVLRLVGGPYDGGVQDVEPATTMIQLGLTPTLEFSQEIGDASEVASSPIKVATYRRRQMVFDDGGDPVEFLCYSEWTDRQAMMWLLRQPFEEETKH